MPKKKGGDLAQDAYDTTASFGLFMALIQAIGATLFALLVIVLGIFLVSMKRKYQGTTTATVTASKCSTNDKATKCVIDYEYTIAGKTYKKTGYEIQGMYITGNKIKTAYDTINPENHELLPLNWNIIGWVCIIAGIVIISISWVWFYIASTFKVAAAASGVGTIVGMTTSSLNTQ